MNLLLDTHTFIWFINGDDELSKTAIKHIEKSGNQNYISISSLWEIAIKISLKKLVIHRPFENLIKLIEINGFNLLPITFDHIIYLSKLPYIHRDPFERLIVSQAAVNDLVLVSKDIIFKQYSVKTIW